jgi:hypothetical protein
MRLPAKQVPHSSIVGGGLTLCDRTGRARFIVNFMGTDAGIRAGVPYCYVEVHQDWGRVMGERIELEGAA